ncbi:hypothetical protein BBJ28_00007679 [Nothophytophthora sp. Chile5]|nr:hypothetical protein BBJ28_00007679 [Nothophytophthora sp. Chile5]
MLCSNGTFADSRSNTCQICPDPAMVLVEAAGVDGHSCDCGDGYQLVSSVRMSVQTCILKQHIDVISSKITLSTASQMTYSSFLAEDTGSTDSVVSLTSGLLDDIFLFAASDCYFYQSERNTISCQALGNLCVLQHFASTVPACAVFELIQRSGRSATANNMSFDEAAHSGTTDHLDFVLASYHVNGTLIGFRSLTNELAYCHPGSSVNAVGSPPWMRFGVSVLAEYSCDLTALQSSALLLHELFLVDQAKSDGEDGRYVPVPVQNLNYRDSNGLLVNQNTRSADSANDFLSHRFFLFDGQSGIPSGESAPKVTRYAQKITLTVKTQTPDSQLIYVPLLSIAYVDTLTPRSVPLAFHVVYASDTASFWSFAVAFFSVACILAGCRVLLQTFNWKRRSIRNVQVDNAVSNSIVALATYGASNFAAVCFGVMFVLCNYFFLFFTLHSNGALLLPEVNNAALADSRDEYYSFRVLLPLAFSCQLASVMNHIYRQTQLQLFFVDWEKPRATVIDIDSAKPTQAPISVWRMILVTNEWNELQTVRKTSLRFTLVAVLFLLYGCDLQSLALPIPRAQRPYVAVSTAAVSSQATDLQLNLYLRFANVSFWWLLICLAQRIWKWLIYERYFDEPREQLFIDLCTVAKVSCFFLDEPYHGYYLHCRSPHPFADGSMGELVDQLRQEEAGLTAGRHLDSTLPDCQTFEIFVTRKWKRKFHALYSAVRGENGVHGRGADGERLIQRSFSPKRATPPTLPLQAADLKRHSGVSTTDAMVHNAGQLRDFLQEFIENQDDKFRWRIYRAHTWLTRFLDLPPDMTASRQSLFLPGSLSFRIAELA